MTRKKTTEEYETELFEKEINFLPVEPYTGAKEHILHECINGHVWSVRPDQILAGIGCPYCYGNNNKNLEEYQVELADRNITAITYNSRREKAKHLCDICSHEWDAKPVDVLKGHGCSKCAYLNQPGGYNNTRFERDRDLATSPGILYVIVLVKKSTSERICVKIGITKGTSNKDVLRRALGFTGYEPRIQKLVHGTLEEVFNLEQELHKKWARYKYTSEWKFGGYSELFEIEKLSDILKSIPKTVGPAKI